MKTDSTCMFDLESEQIHIPWIGVDSQEQGNLVSLCTKTIPSA